MNYTQRKSVLIKAYLNHNFGDDLFVKILIERYPKCRFKIIIPDRGYDYLDEYENVDIIVENKFWKIVNLLSIKLCNVVIYEKIIENKCDCTVKIGGSLFIQSDNWEKTICREKNNFLRKNRNFLIGCNFGPYSNENYLHEYSKWFASYEDICFRDESSYKLFEEMSNVRVAPDIVFSLKLENAVSNSKEISFSIIDTEKKLGIKNSEYVKKMVEVIQYFSQLKYKINLISFCENEGDLTIIERITKCLNYNCIVNIYNYSNNINSILAVLNKSEIIIATRFHCMIIGWLLKKKVYPIIYSDKMINVINDVKYEGDYIYLNKIADLNPENIRYNANYLVDIENLQNESFRQFSKLDKYLNGDIYE